MILDVDEQIITDAKIECVTDAFCSTILKRFVSWDSEGRIMHYINGNATFNERYEQSIRVDKYFKHKYKLLKKRLKGYYIRKTVTHKYLSNGERNTIYEFSIDEFLFRIICTTDGYTGVKQKDVYSSYKIEYDYSDRYRNTIQNRN